MGTGDHAGRLRSGRGPLAGLAAMLTFSGGIGLESAHLLLTRPAGKLPSFMPGYVAGSVARHSPRYGHDVHTIALVMLAVGLALGVALLVAVVADRGGDVARAARQFGVPARFGGFTDGGSEIVLVDGHRLVYRRGGYWRPRVMCPTCDRECTGSTVKISSSDDLARLDATSRRECTSCQQGRRVMLKADAD